MVELALALTAIAVISGFVAEHESARFLEAGIWGWSPISWLTVSALCLVENPARQTQVAASGAAGFCIWNWLTLHSASMA